jgi:hypothetical protein
MAVHLQQSYAELEHKAATRAAMATENAALYRQGFFAQPPKKVYFGD